jgi:hypothetical protein
MTSVRLPTRFWIILFYNSLALSGLLFSGDWDHFRERIKRPGRVDVHSFLGDDANLAGKNINVIEKSGQILLQTSKNIALVPSMNTICIWTRYVTRSANKSDVNISVLNILSVLTNIDDVHDEIRGTINSGNTWIHQWVPIYFARRWRSGCFTSELFSMTWKVPYFEERTWIASVWKLGEPKIFESKKEVESEQLGFCIKRNLMIHADNLLLLGEFHLGSYDGPGISLGWRDKNA